MMRYLLLIALVIFSDLTYGQNIIQNWSFEEVTFCPSGPGGIFRAPPWTRSSGSPDLFNVCGDFGYGVPVNKVGHQQPRTGEGYALFATYSGNIPDAREYAQNELLYALIGEEQYYFEAYVSQCDSLQFATHNVGITFTETDQESGLACNLDCEIYFENDASNPLTSKTDWMKVNGTFISAISDRIRPVRLNSLVEGLTRTLDGMRAPTT